MGLFVVVITLAGTSAAWGQASVTFTPPNPRATDAITARISYTISLCNSMSSATMVNGFTIRTTISFSGCLIGPIGNGVEFAHFGPLPDGTYTYEVYLQGDNDPPILQTRVPLVIAPVAATPTLSDALLIALGAALATAGILSLRRF